MRRIETCLGLMLVLVGIPAAVVAADPPAPAAKEPVLFFGRSRIEVDAQGKVVAAQAPKGVPEAVGAAMLEHLYKVRFTAPMKDGHAVGGVTYARQEACAIPDGDQYRLAVRYLGNGPGDLRPKDKPVALRMAADTRPGAAPVVLKVSYKVLTDGSLAVDTIDVVSGRGPHSGDYVSGIRTWLESQLADPEQVDGLAVPTQINFNMVFNPGRTFYGSWARVQAEKHAQAANEAARQAQIKGSQACALAREGQSQSQHVAINSPFTALAEDAVVQ